MKISEVLKNGIYVLKEKNIEDSNLKARMLLSYLLGTTKEYLITHDTEIVSVEQQREFYRYLDRLILGEPIQYIIQKQEFMGLDFYVDKNVLIPQPDTEMLVQGVEKYVKHICGKEYVKLFDYITKNKKNDIKILDLCTGSGAIAVSLCKRLPFCKVYASDVSKNALSVAKKNAIKNNVNINFIESDLFENIKEKYDIIVSNPPYIKSDIIQTLSKEVQNEPRLALDGGRDGLDFYVKIIKDAKKYLNENGIIFLEIGYDQKNDVVNILKKEEYKNIKSFKDFAENDRLIIAEI